MITVPATSQEPRVKFPLTFELSDPSLPKRFRVKISQIRAVSNLRLGKKIGVAEASELDTILDGLNEVLGR